MVTTRVNHVGDLLVKRGAHKGFIGAAAADANLGMVQQTADGGVQCADLNDREVSGEPYVAPLHPTAIQFPQTGQVWPCASTQAGLPYFPRRSRLSPAFRTSFARTTSLPLSVNRRPVIWIASPRDM